MELLHTNAALINARVHLRGKLAMHERIDQAPRKLVVPRVHRRIERLPPPRILRLRPLLQPRSRRRNTLLQLVKEHNKHGTTTNNEQRQYNRNQPTNRSENKEVDDDNRSSVLEAVAAQVEDHCDALDVPDGHSDAEPDVFDCDGLERFLLIGVQVHVLAEVKPLAEGLRAGTAAVVGGN